MKSAVEIREYFLNRLQCALFRPSMFGGELGILNLMESMAFIDERSEEWRNQRKELHRRKAFNARGVTGGFEQRLGFHGHDALNNEVASVYAVIAFRMGYLSMEGDDCLNRLLSADEFDSLYQQAKLMVKDEPCVPDDVIQRFGAPSIRWGTNSNYPCTLLYLCESDNGLYLHFDFWAEWIKNADGIQVPGKFGPKPLLRNIRIPAETFSDEFVFTSFGIELLAVPRKTPSGGD